MIKIINCKDIVSYGTTGFASEPNEKFITDFKRINILIGGNNSGKSRFLRLIIGNLRKIFDLNKRLNSYLITQKPIMDDNLKKLYNITKQEVFNVSLNSGIIKNDFWSNFRKDTLDVINQSITIHGYKHNELSEARAALKNIQSIYENIFQENPQNNLSSINSSIPYTYIPILRGLKPILLTKDENGVVNDYKDVYAIRITTDYPNIKNVVTGLEINEEIKKRLLGDEKERELIKDFETYISINLFDEKVTLIPKYGENILNIKIGEDEQRSIVNLGDGLQSLICILFPIFMEKGKEHYFFIEEPELNLHPQLQKKLINLLSAPIFNQHQYFITSHSAHIIDHENASIYNFTKKDKKTKITHLDNQSKIVSALNIMGYTPSDLLQTNFIIWVEGPSDKIYINYLLNKLSPELIENQHYVIMFYGGSSGKKLLLNDDSLSTYLNINRNFAWIMDSDRNSSAPTDKNYLEAKEISDKLSSFSIYTWITPYKEFENHIDSELFLQAVRDILREEDAELTDNGNYSDRFLIKTKEKLNKSPKQNIKLTNKLYDLIKDRGNKNKVANIDIETLKSELQISIDQTINFKEQKVNCKVQIAEYIVAQGFTPDKHLENLINELISRIKTVNSID